MLNFLKKKPEILFSKVDINKFYNMLLKMKKKRPNMNISWIMINLYGSDFMDYINSK